MFIKKQTFKDEDTLLEMLFDFSLGEPAGLIRQYMADIDAELETNEAYQQYKASLTDEEDREELYDEESRLRLAEKLMADYEHFAVRSQKLYGVKGGTKDVLYEVDLY